MARCNGIENSHRDRAKAGDWTNGFQFHVEAMTDTDIKTGPYDINALAGIAPRSSAPEAAFCEWYRGYQYAPCFVGRFQKMRAYGGLKDVISKGFGGRWSKRTFNRSL
jgi:hypothetical protein